MKIPDKEHISKLKFHDILEKSLQQLEGLNAYIVRFIINQP